LAQLFKNLPPHPSTTASLFCRFAVCQSGKLVVALGKGLQRQIFTAK